jgi:hypothetical protein
VATVRRAPSSHSAAFFERDHGTLAAAAPASCASCHTRNQCERCHTDAAASAAFAAAAPPPSHPQIPAAVALPASGPTPAMAAGERRVIVPTEPSAGRYHPANFTARHGSAAWGRNLECANCHEAATFCRACHEESGMRAEGRLDAGFHDAQPAWLLNHGRPARQGLETCASCHGQRDCLQCHSELGAFRVNPHGPGFDARRMWARNARVCAACHLGNPFAGG